MELKHTPWNKGLTKETDSRIARLSEKLIANHKGMLGKRHSEETKQRIREAQLEFIKRGGIGSNRIGHFVSAETKRKISIGISRYFAKLPDENKKLIYQRLKKIARTNGFKGKKHSEETKTRLSLYRGELASGWLGGITNNPYPYEFNRELKERIRKRDDYTCQLCGALQAGRALDVHHIDYNKGNIRDDNLISLCYTCNPKVNKDRDFWQLFFANKMRSIQCALLASPGWESTQPF